MEFDELLITTGVDALVRLVRDKQRIELEEAASALNIGRETLEEWSRVLEEEGILRMEYRLTRTYLVWVKPTGEEVASEVESFKEAKKDIEEEVAQVGRKAVEQTAGFDELRKSFREFYSKAYPRMERLEKEVAKLPSLKAVTDNAAAKRQESLQAMASQLDAVRAGVADARDELKNLAIERNATESGAVLEKVERLSGDLASMQEELQELRRKVTKTEPIGVALPPLTEMKKKFEAMRKEFTDLRSRNAKMREDMLSLQESSQILNEVAESIVGREEKVSGLHQEMAALAAESDALMKKAKELDAKVKEDRDLAERFESSVNVAKGILTRFPSQDKAIAELDRIGDAEKGLAEKIDGLNTLMEAAGGKQASAKVFADLAKRMDEKTEEMKREMDSLSGSLEDEKATYLTFQKIKEKVVPSIESYQKQLDTLGKEMERMKGEAAAAEGGVEEDAKRLAQTLKGTDAQEALKTAQEIVDKKKMLEEVSQSLEDMNLLSENLNKRITLLAREAKILEIRASGGTGSEEAEKAAKSEEVRADLKLTQEEEREFEKKREELRSLIKKLWE
jgi:chromosome segregation ATPase